MYYPDDFKKELKEVYPDSKEMHDLADKGGYFLGRYLDDSSYGTGVSIDEILTALTLEELQAKARIQKRKINLYRSWSKLAQEQK